MHRHARAITDLTPKELAHDARAIRRLARALVRDPSLAEDVAQEASIALLRGPLPAVGARRAWLTSVVVNSLRLLLRKSARLERTESAAAQEAAVSNLLSPDVLLEGARTRALLAESVLVLDEPFRSTLLLRFYEGLSSAQIARTSGVPPGTVRWRLKTGLERLRSVLDARHGGRRTRWAGLIALVPPPRRWPARAPLGAALGVAGPLGVLALAVLLVGAGATSEAGAPAGRTGPALGPPPLRLRVSAVAGIEGGSAQAVDTLGASADAGRQSGLEVHGRAVDVEGAPVAGARIEAARLDAPGGPRLETSADHQGRYQLDLPAGEYRFTASARGHIRDHRDRRLAQASTVDFELGPAGRVRGQVVDRQAGRPIPGATVRLRGNRNDLDAITDFAGVFALEDVPIDLYRVYARSGESAGPATGELAVTAASVGDVVIPIGPASAIAGRIADLQGRAVAGAVVCVRGDLLPGPLRVESGSVGEYRVAGLLPGSYRVSVEVASHARRDEPVTLGAGDWTLDVVVAPEATLAGWVTAAGQPVARAQVHVQIEDPRRSLTLRSTSTTADGRFVLRGLPAGAARIQARVDGQQTPARDLRLVAGNHEEVSLAVPCGHGLAGTVRWQESGAPAAGALVAAFGPGGLLALTTANSDGLYRLDSLSTGPLAIRAYQPSNAPMQRLRQELALFPIPTTADRETVLALMADDDVAGVDLALPIGGLAVAGVVLDVHGQPLSGVRVQARPQGSTAWQSKLAGQPHPYRAFTGPRGAFRLHDLPAGPVVLTIEYPGRPTLELPATPGDLTITVHLDVCEGSDRRSCSRSSAP
jgi:RNA polymerase sigma factor (sigma-70 family)